MGEQIPDREVDTEYTDLSDVIPAMAPAQRVESSRERPDIFRFRRLAGPDALDVSGLTDDRIISLMENDLLGSPVDIFLLPRQEDWIAGLPGWNADTAHALVDEIEHRRTMDLGRFVRVLFIQGLDGADVTAVTDCFGTITRLMDAMEKLSVGEAIQAPSLDEGILDRLSVHFGDRANRKVAFDLVRELVVNPVQSIDADAAAI